MKWTCNFSVGPGQVSIIFSNDTNGSIIYVIHASVKGARKYILEYLDSKKADLDAMGDIWFFNHSWPWSKIRSHVDSILDNF